MACSFQRSWFVLVSIAATSGSWTAAEGKRESRPVGTRDAPFYLGAWVGADLFAWGDLLGMGEDSASTIDAISADLASLGCNAVWVAGFAPWFAETPRIGLWLDTAEKHQLKAVIQGSGFPYAIPKGEERLLARTRSEVVPFWKSVARQWGRHPALLAYCPVEEIGDNVEKGETVTLDALAEVGRAVARIDPVHPVTTIHISTWFNVAKKEAEIRGRDLRVLVMDLYVFTHVHDWSLPVNTWATPDEATRGYLEWTGRHVRLARSAGVPLWVFAQANETTWVRKLGGARPESRPNFRMPTPPEMSFQVWAAILAGAKGVFFFPYNSTPEPPPDSQANLEEWEHGVGMRTLQGEPTASHEGLARVGQKVREYLNLLGRLVPESEVSEIEKILARTFRDPRGDDRFLVLLNRDVENSRPIPNEFIRRSGLPAGTTLEAGEGRLTPSNAGQK
ncbi:MAG: hypothetical protein HYU36_15825 [Planctomycetes bacterium]|nr:hypothetical protein [Planctomycetota bacterium]